MLMRCQGERGGGTTLEECSELMCAGSDSPLWHGVRNALASPDAPTWEGEILVLWFCGIYQFLLCTHG